MISIKEKNRTSDLITNLEERFKKDGFETQSSDDILEIDELKFEIKSEHDAFIKAEHKYIVPAKYEEWIIYVMIYVVLKVQQNRKIVDDAEEYVEKLGVPHNLNRFDEMIQAMIIFAFHKENTDQNINRLYMVVAALNNSSASSVSKNIRYAIEKAYSKNKEVVIKLFRHNPCNTEVIAHGASTVRKLLY